MIAYVTVGADDIARARRFYSSFLPALNYRLTEGPEGLSYVLPPEPGQRPVYPDFYVKPPFDGEAASTGNGVMVAFEAQTQQQVRDLHAAALAAGDPMKGSRVFVPHMAPGFMWGICAIRRATRSRCFPAIRTNPGATDRALPAKRRAPALRQMSGQAGAEATGTIVPCNTAISFS